MKKALFLAILIPLSFVTTGCAFCTDGSGNVTQENFDVKNFSHVDLSGQGTIHLTQGEHVSVEIETDDNILENLEVYVKNDTLVIKPKRLISCFNPTENIDIYLTMEDIESFDLSGSGKIEGESAIKTDTLDIDLSGSGQIDLDIEANELKIDISGSGTAELEGGVKKNEFEVSGSGKLLASELETDDTKVSISGSGKAEVWANDTLDIDISGSGRVSYKGSPEINQDVSGSGKIEKMEEKTGE